MDERHTGVRWAMHARGGHRDEARHHHHGSRESRRGRWGGGAWGGWGFGPPWAGGGPRARRGDIRTGILSLLNEQPMHGYQVIQELEERSGGAWRPSAGSVYPTLQLLEDEGLISGAEVEGKRVFTLTDAGRKAVADRPEGELPWTAMAGEAGDLFHQLRDAFFSLGAAGMQVARAGNREQAQKTLDVLVEARKRIYAILAEDD